MWYSKNKQWWDRDDDMVDLIKTNTNRPFNIILYLYIHNILLCSTLHYIYHIYIYHIYIYHIYIYHIYIYHIYHIYIYHIYHIYIYHIYIHIYIYIRIHACMHAYIHTYRSYIHTDHTHIHIYIYIIYIYIQWYIDIPVSLVPGPPLVVSPLPPHAERAMRWSAATFGALFLAGMAATWQWWNRNISRTFWAT